jgi:hypothetical protein
MNSPDEVLAPLLAEAEADANVVGVFLKGSRAVGTDVAGSDWDVVVVLREGEASQHKDDVVDILRTSIETRQARSRTRLRPPRGSNETSLRSCTTAISTTSTGR